MRQIPGRPQHFPSMTHATLEKRSGRPVRLLRLEMQRPLQLATMGLVTTFVAEECAIAGYFTPLDQC